MQTCSTPMASVLPPTTNTLTVTRKGRTRQQTITVGSQVLKEIDSVFEDVLEMKDLNNPNEELRRRIQKLFLEKEKEYIYKLSEIEKNKEEELAFTKIKLNSALKTISKVELFFQHYKQQSTANEISTSPKKVLSPSNYTTKLVGNGIPGAERTVTPDAYTDLIKERNSLRDELRELENSYSDLFKRYEKMRENCVLLKNTEEILKKNSEDDAAKYEKLLLIYNELRNTAAQELNKANIELVKLEKQHEENTLSLRCRLKRVDSEINTLNMTIQGKDNQIEELNKLCDDLMRKNCVIDEENVSVADSFDDFQ